MGNICAFFGHRDTPSDVEDSIEKLVRKLITQENVDTFWVGGYGKFDALAARVVHKLKNEFPQISLVLILAYPRQLHQYGENFIFDAFDYPPEVEAAPYKFAISARNRFMARNADFIITYIAREYGGAYKAVNLALKFAKCVYFIER